MSNPENTKTAVEHGTMCAVQAPPNLARRETEMRRKLKHFIMFSYARFDPIDEGASKIIQPHNIYVLGAIKTSLSLQ